MRHLIRKKGCVWDVKSRGWWHRLMQARLCIKTGGNRLGDRPPKKCESRRSSFTMSTFCQVPRWSWASIRRCVPVEKHVEGAQIASIMPKLNETNVSQFMHTRNAYYPREPGIRFALQCTWISLRKSIYAGRRSSRCSITPNRGGGCVRRGDGAYTWQEKGLLPETQTKIKNRGSILPNELMRERGRNQDLTSKKARYFLSTSTFPATSGPCTALLTERSKMHGH